MKTTRKTRGPGAEEPTVTVAEAAEMIGVVRQRVQQYVEAGVIRVVRRVSTVRLLSRADVEKVAASDRKSGPKPKPKPTGGPRDGPPRPPTGKHKKGATQ